MMKRDDEFKHLIVKLFVTLKALTLRLLLTRRPRAAPRRSL